MYRVCVRVLDAGAMFTAGVHSTGLDPALGVAGQKWVELAEGGHPTGAGMAELPDAAVVDEWVEGGAQEAEDQQPGTHFEKPCPVIHSTAERCTQAEHHQGRQ